MQINDNEYAQSVYVSRKTNFFCKTTSCKLLFYMSNKN